ncbi:hypothetical protein, partial [Halobacillus seohaensis]
RIPHLVFLSLKLTYTDYCTSSATPCGISPIMFIPQESHNFPDLLAFVRRTEASDVVLQLKST